MDVKSLRSQIQFICPDLHSLTLADLLDCKWPIVKRVIVSLMIRCPLLRECNEKLDLLLESREIEMNNRRQALTQKKCNIDRNERMENEKEFRTKFMNIVLDGLTLLRWPPALEAFADPISALLSDKNTILNLFAFLAQCILPTNKVLGNIIQLNTSSDIKEADLTCPGSDDSNNLSKEHTKNIKTFKLRNTSNTLLNKNDATDLSIIEDFKSLDAFNPVKSLSDISVETNSVLGKNSISVFRSPKDVSNNSCKKCYNNPEFVESFEVLQYQNEILSRQVKTLHETMHKREQLEIYISSLLLDLNLTLDDVTGITANCVATKETFQNLTPRSQGSRQKVATTAHVNDANTYSVNSSTNFIWTQLKTKIVDLRSQWEETMQVSRKILLTEFKLPENSKEYVDFSPSIRHSKSPRGISGGPADYVHKPSSIRLNQILGVNPLSSNADSEVTSNQGIGLDVSRIHTIQRDLVTFVDSAYEFSQGLEKSKISNENMKELIEKLKDKAQNLLLRVSYLAPIAPLSADHPYSSSLTGIDLLLDEIIKLSPNTKISKTTINKLQAAGSRSKSEQTAIARCLCNNDKRHILQRQQSSEALPALKLIQEDLILKITSFTNFIKNILNSVRSLNHAYSKAEAARIRDSIHNKVVSPLVSITNGSLGVEMANFINTFKASAGDIEELESRLKSMILSIKLGTESIGV